MRTNIFLNSYSQPENKLTYNFLTIVDLLNDTAFCNFLTGRSLVEKPVTGINLVYGGRKSNPDGSFMLKQTDGKTITVYFENQTYRRGLTIDQLLGHLDYCRDDDILLVITPRHEDIDEVKKINNPKVKFKTWGDVAGYLNKHESPIARHFVEYGKLSGEFEELGELHGAEIRLFCSTFKINFDRKIENIFQALHYQLDLSPFGFNTTNKKRQNIWGKKQY